MLMPQTDAAQFLSDKFNIPIENVKYMVSMPDNKLSENGFSVTYIDSRNSQQYDLFINRDGSLIIYKGEVFQEIVNETSPNVPDPDNSIVAALTGTSLVESSLVHPDSYEAGIVYKAFGRWNLRKWKKLKDAGRTDAQKALFDEAASHLGFVFTLTEPIKMQLERHVMRNNKSAQELLDYIRFDFAPDYEQPNFWKLDEAIEYSDSHGGDYETMMLRRQGAMLVHLATISGALRGALRGLGIGAIVDLALF